MPTLDYYQCLGIEPKLTVDVPQLQQRFYELSRRWHPDRFAGRGPAEQQEALEKTALLNDAFRTLRDPVARAEYVLKAHGFDIGEQRTKDVPPELLEEVFELNLALDEIRSGDDSARQQLEWSREKFNQTLAGIDSGLDGLFAAWDQSGSRDTLQEIRGVLNRRKYISNLVRTAGQALEAA